MGSVYRQQPKPGNFLVGASLGEARVLEGVAENLVECELADSYLGEARIARVEAQAGRLTGSVEPVRPVRVDDRGLYRQVVGSVRSRKSTDLRLELVYCAANGARGSLGVDRTLGLPQSGL